MPGFATSSPTSAILATAVLPWTENYEFDEASFERQVRTIAAQLTRHIYIFGTAGEGYAVSDAQFLRIARVFRQCARECGAEPMLGVISLSLPTIVERIAAGRELGFREFQLSLPAWGTLQDGEVDRFFAETCGRFPDCRFLHYNLARAGRVLQAGDYVRLIAAHPNLTAIKMSPRDPAVIATLMALAPRLRCYFTEFAYAVARRIGPCGLLASLSTVHPERAHEFVATGDERRAELMGELETVAGTLAGLGRHRFHIDGAFDKLLYRTHDPVFPLRLLPPYASATEADFAQFSSALPPSWRRLDANFS